MLNIDNNVYYVNIKCIKYNIKLFAVKFHKICKLFYYTNLSIASAKIKKREDRQYKQINLEKSKQTNKTLDWQWYSKSSTFLIMAISFS